MREEIVMLCDLICMMWVSLPLALVREISTR